MKKIIFVCVFFVISLTSKSQYIQGRLIDSLTKAPLPYSNFIIKNFKDSTITGVLTNKKGEFKINVKSTGDIKIVANSMGYKEKILLLNNIKNSETYKIGEIALAQKSYQLNEANVEGHWI